MSQHVGRRAGAGLWRAFGESPPSLLLLRPIKRINPDEVHNFHRSHLFTVSRSISFQTYPLVSPPPPRNQQLVANRRDTFGFLPVNDRTLVRQTSAAWRQNRECALAWKLCWSLEQRRWKSGYKNVKIPTHREAQKTPNLSDQKTSEPFTGTNENLLHRLPHNLYILQRQKKNELLAAATGFWARLKVHFKWATIKSVRPFNMDDISAFFSWILLGHVVWIIVGTTTFFSLLILLINSVFAQGTSPHLALRCVLITLDRNPRQMDRELYDKILRC